MDQVFYCICILVRFFQSFFVGLFYFSFKKWHNWKPTEFITTGKRIVHTITDHATLNIEIDVENGG